ncbi:hypothetical protein TNCV_2515591 [Trichonephila clavipes]|nr:hypothetical protein TNCV_2515591 [Trichonephila clavipes]
MGLGLLQNIFPGSSLCHQLLSVPYTGGLEISVNGVQPTKSWSSLNFTTHSFKFEDHICDMQPKATQSSRAGALNRNQNKENFWTLEQRKREAAKENAREVGKPIDENSACVEVGKPIDENPACVEVGTNSV